MSTLCMTNWGSDSLTQTTSTAKEDDWATKAVKRNLACIEQSKKNMKFEDDYKPESFNEDGTYPKGYWDK